MQQCGGSSGLLLALVPLSLLSQSYSTAPPSPKRYDKRYEERFLRKKSACGIYPRRQAGPEDVEVGDTSQLTRSVSMMSTLLTSHESDEEAL